jgi:hypothetical protein
MLDHDAYQQAFENGDYKEERSWDQIRMGIGILLGGDLEIKDVGDVGLVPEYLLVGEDSRGEEILEAIDEYEEDGDIALRDKLREQYFNNGFDQYEGTEVNITDEGEVEYMEGIDNFDMSEEIADA